MTNEQRAVKYVKAFEEQGKEVRKVTVDGKSVTVEFAVKDGSVPPVEYVEW